MFFCCLCGSLFSVLFSGLLRGFFIFCLGFIVGFLGFVVVNVLRNSYIFLCTIT